MSVPFGKRTVEGYVVRVKETSEYPEDKLKDIIEPLDPYPVVLPEMLELMRFMADRYHLRLADVLKLFIPAGRRGGRVRELVRQYAHINPEFLHRDEATFIRPSAKAQLEVFRYLADNGSVSVTELNREFSASALKNLIMRDIVRVEDVEVKRTPYRYMECGDQRGDADRGAGCGGVLHYGRQRRLFTARRDGQRPRPKCICAAYPKRSRKVRPPSCSCPKYRSPRRC